MKRNYKSGLLGTHIVVVCVHAFPDEGWSRTTRVVSLHCCCGSCFVLYNGQANFAMPKYFLGSGIIFFMRLAAVFSTIQAMRRRSYCEPGSQVHTS
jgi:hypothetical protein